MSLYTSVYWTKRVLVVFALVIFLCGGFRVFQFISSSLTEQNVQVSEFRPERGFGKIDRILLDGMSVPEDFNPSQYRISTTKGNLDADNGYPLDSTVDPISNVYRITEKEINLSTTEDPIRIARTIGFTTNPEIVNSTTRRWEQSNRELTIEGLYLLIDYENKTLRLNNAISQGIISRTDQNTLRTQFTSVLREFDLAFPDASSYVFDAEYVVRDNATDTFVNSGIANSGSHLRINAKRIYPNLVKTNETATARGAYQGGTVSNNYVILPVTLASNSTTPLIQQISEFKFYNWPVNQTIAATNPNVQTYPIKTPRQAYAELSSNQGYLVSAYESATRKPMNTTLLSNVGLVDVLSIRIDNYESKAYRRFIQPVYIFTCEVIIQNTRYQLLYYIPAIPETELL